MTIKYLSDVLDHCVNTTERSLFSTLWEWLHFYQSIDGHTRHAMEIFQISSVHWAPSTTPLSLDVPSLRNPHITYIPETRVIGLHLWCW